MAQASDLSDLLTELQYHERNAIERLKLRVVDLVFCQTPATRT